MCIAGPEKWVGTDKENMCILARFKYEIYSTEEFYFFSQIRHLKLVTVFKIITIYFCSLRFIISAKVVHLIGVFCLS